MTVEEKIKAKALELGFDAVGITTAKPLEGEKRYFEKWLAAGNAGQMGYLGRNVEKRFAPVKLMPGARSVIVCGLSYKVPELARPAGDGHYLRISDYALFTDYHVFIKRMLSELAEYVQQVTGSGKFKVCVDSVPLAERALAARAGVGFIGRNHQLISPRLGGQIFLGEIITAADLKPDALVEQGCGDCRRCLDACPTGALSEAGFDARKCVSYLTIECREPIPRDLEPGIGNRLFGCDECVLSCPYNQRAPLRSNGHLAFYPQRAWVKAEYVLEMGEDEFARHFGGSCLERMGLGKLKETARICLANLKANEGK